MIFKGAQKAAVSRLTVAPTLRKFSNSIKPPTQSNTGAMLLMGGAFAGMGYLTYSSMQLS